jgi:FkbM family methyltransferase
MSSFMKRQLSGAVRAILGRTNTARLGRFLYGEACLAAGLYPDTLCDRLVQESVCRSAIQAGKPLVLIDVGANIGEWSRSFSQALTAAGITHRIHAIEAFPETYSTLVRNLNDWGLSEIVIPFQGALSSAPGEHTFYSLGANIGQNSLHPIPGAEGISKTTSVTCYRLDDLLDSWGIPDVAYLKIDTEGHDLNVLQGTSKWLATGRIPLLQFEYNHRWVVSRYFLRDAFEFLVPFGYRLGRITRLGIEFYEAWHPELETFREGNFLAAQGDAARTFPTIPWWNQ